MTVLRTLFWALFATTLIALPKPTHAGDENDLRAPGELLKQQLAIALREPDKGFEGRELHAWKAQLKRRASKMNRRVKILMSEKKWVLDDEGRATALDPSQFTRAIQELSGLYTELNAASKGYGKVKVSEKGRRKAWDKSHPMPKLITKTPSYSSLVSLRNDIKRYRRQGYMVPSDWLRQERELVRQCEKELKDMQEAWRASKEAAYAGITEQANVTREALKERQRQFADTQELIRNWMVMMQAAEEASLRKQVGILSEERKKEAEKLFKDMVSGRKALSSRFADFGNVTRQKWARPRNKLVSLIKKQQTDDKKAAKAAAEGGADQKDGPGTEGADK